MIHPLRLATAITLLGLAGCAALGGPKSEVSVHAPRTAISADPAWPTVDWQLTVATPDTHALLDSQRIAVRPSPDRLQTYKGARWADSAPELVQLALLQGFEDSGRIASVWRWGGGRGDLGLFTDLRAFETVYTDGRPEVVVELQARLVRFRGNDGLVAARRFRVTATPAGEQIDPVVAAFGEALSELSTQVVGWALVEGERSLTATAKEAPAGR